ncbi:hypothetical protein [Millionella massiliensis]|uniref:hypothetical protein n=1 Tax=Millionella massiliensis TaxID=1871023 RepID=UPI0008D9FD8E|nr:hypothetical protein [Millionella massiliensis]
MKTRYYLLLATSFTLMSCGRISEQQYAALQTTCDSLTTVIQTLNKEIDELKNGEARLVNLAKNAYDSQNYILAEQYIQQLKTKHPESNQIAYFQSIEPKLKQKASEQRAIEEKRIKDSIRLANIDNLGIWQIGYYVDNFGDQTSEAYVSTDIMGTFSNSATTNSDLAVRFLIDKKSIRIQLYEYARNHPIKGEGIVVFTARDANGTQYSFETFNSDSGDNGVSRDGYDMRKDYDTIMKLLKSGGQIKFIAVANRFGSPSEYKFTINNADFFDNALLKAGIEAL